MSTYTPAKMPRPVANPVRQRKRVPNQVVHPEYAAGLSSHRRLVGRDTALKYLRAHRAHLTDGQLRNVQLALRTTQATVASAEKRQVIHALPHKPPVPRRRTGRVKVGGLTQSNSTTDDVSKVDLGWLQGYTHAPTSKAGKGPVRTRTSAPPQAPQPLPAPRPAIVVDNEFQRGAARRRVNGPRGSALASGGVTLVPDRVAVPGGKQRDEVLPAVDNAVFKARPVQSLNLIDIERRVARGEEVTGEERAAHDTNISRLTSHYLGESKKRRGEPQAAEGASLPTISVEPNRDDLLSHYRDMSAAELQQALLHNYVGKEIIGEVRELLKQKSKVELRAEGNQAVEALTNNPADINPLSEPGVNSSLPDVDEGQVRALEREFMVPYHKQNLDNPIERLIQDSENFWAAGVPSIKVERPVLQVRAQTQGVGNILDRFKDVSVYNTNNAAPALSLQAYGSNSTGDNLPGTGFRRVDINSRAEDADNGLDGFWRR